MASLDWLKEFKEFLDRPAYMLAFGLAGSLAFAAPFLIPATPRTAPLLAALATLQAGALILALLGYAFAVVFGIIKLASRTRFGPNPLLAAQEFLEAAEWATILAAEKRDPKPLYLDEGDRVAESLLHKRIIETHGPPIRRRVDIYETKTWTPYHLVRSARKHLREQEAKCRELAVAQNPGIDSYVDRRLRDQGQLDRLALE